MAATADVGPDARTACPAPRTLGKEKRTSPPPAASNSRARAHRDPGKFNGATGNYNAHRVALADIDWPGRVPDFVESLGLRWKPYTQIEPHDWSPSLAELGQPHASIGPSSEGRRLDEVPGHGGQSMSASATRWAL